MADLRLPCMLTKIGYHGITVEMQGTPITVELYPMAWKYKYAVIIHGTWESICWLSINVDVEGMLKKLADGDAFLRACAILAGSFKNIKTQRKYTELLVLPVLEGRKPSGRDVADALRSAKRSIMSMMNKAYIARALRKLHAIVESGRILAQHLADAEVTQLVRELETLLSRTLCDAVEEVLSA